MSLFEGSCIGKAVDVEFGADKSGRPRVRWNMQVIDGEHKGKVANYSGKLDPENIKWTKRDMIAIGWKGVDVRTFVDDVKSANRTVPFTAEIASYDRPDGSRSEWTSAKMTGALPLAALDKDKVADVNQWFKEAGDVGAPSNGASAGGASNDDIPFASCDLSFEPSPIARVLR